jgi:hypothetical protein
MRRRNHPPGEPDKVGLSQQSRAKAQAEEKLDVALRPADR